MMSRHFALNSELAGAIAKILPHAKNQLSALGSFFNQFVTDIYIYIYIYYIRVLQESLNLMMHTLQIVYLDHQVFTIKLCNLEMV